MGDVFAGVVSVAFSPDADLIAADSIDTVVRVWGIVTVPVVDRLRGHHASVCSVSFTHDGKGLVSGLIHQTLKFGSSIQLLHVKPTRSSASVVSAGGHR